MRERNCSSQKTVREVLVFACRPDALWEQGAGGSNPLTPTTFTLGAKPPLCWLGPFREARTVPTIKDHSNVGIVGFALNLRRAADYDVKRCGEAVARMHPLLRDHERRGWLDARSVARVRDRLMPALLSGSANRVAETRS